MSTLRSHRVKRTTRETDITLTLDLDGPLADPQINTGLPLFDHFLSAFAQHSGYGMDLKATGDLAVDPHHLIEDVGIVLGDALQVALGDRRGIQRFGQRYLPMDEALVLVVLDISGRGQLFWSGPFPDRSINNVASEVWPEFFKGLAQHGGLTLHLICQFGTNAHHVYEAAFKGLGRALAEATHSTGSDDIPSTKGSLTV
ncbi:MAG: imidazoleglycerol-phosphate dehydratase HisB [Firmicutes bacterium]|jgi:imidazoleglycerol-phosphate dehydratase|nr:imidazoleglycerol-phosphate dehydratase HisB [Bacillota bacterium]